MRANPGKQGRGRAGRSHVLVAGRVSGLPGRMWAERVRTSPREGTLSRARTSFYALHLPAASPPPAPTRIRCQVWKTGAASVASRTHGPQPDPLHLRATGLSQPIPWSLCSGTRGLSSAPAGHTEPACGRLGCSATRNTPPPAAHVTSRCISLRSACVAPPAAGPHPNRRPGALRWGETSAVASAPGQAVGRAPGGFPSSRWGSPRRAASLPGGARCSPRLPQHDSQLHTLFLTWAQR